MIELFPSRTVAIEVLGFGIHWYGMMYLLAFLAAAVLLPRLQKWRGLTLGDEEWSRLLSAGVLGVIVGGRLGYVLFYNPAYYLATPSKIFAVWEGGMSFHGGLIGVTLCLSFVMRHWSWERILRVADIVVVPAALGLAFGRIGNFINGELYGPVTTLPWATSFPGVEGLRHPTPLYECLYSLVISLSCYLTLRQSSVVGRSFAVFLLLYGVFRFLVEFVRIPDVPTTEILGIVFSRGQLLTLPVFAAGAFLYWWTSRGGRSGGGAHKVRAV